ncbi:uncharacterized protein K452DRAFT_302041 [Aplosporella prunicola CBS 121167]|uniref:Uncharacterized protein n=1 Tax=Aplosporella prunicola CBS 121167 TaxID=1176127 RepID=A0A6A6AZD4_9PEZI|nr:uncharacterized protein K452DRAFT_302041 [Aplosporella prunicola CBS 121167]KAF2137279.1 hypothetical protein K452DRAFT_302041 [Aplosporella prunicola CBS 121167]
MVILHNNELPPHIIAECFILTVLYVILTDILVISASWYFLLGVGLVLVFVMDGNLPLRGCRAS